MDRRPPTGPIRSDVVAKPGGGTRRLTRLSRPDDVRFRSLVAPVVPAIERRLAPTVFANRAARSARPAALAPWRPAHRRWRGAVDAGLAGGGAAIVTDVAECYGSISPQTVGRALRAVGAAAEHADAIVGWLGALARAGVPGLPIGPEPSAILANAVLARGDAALDLAGARWFRWVDDWVIVAEDLSEAERALEALARALARDGLALHGRKTTRWPDARDARVTAPSAAARTIHPPERSVASVP
jgi:hypothetical protein